MLCILCKHNENCRLCPTTDGVCSKTIRIAQLEDQLLGALIGLARSTYGNEHKITSSVPAIIVESLAYLQDSSNTDKAKLEVLLLQAAEEKQRLVPNCATCAMPCGRTADYDMNKLWNINYADRQLKTELLSNLCRIAVQSVHEKESDYTETVLYDYLYQALFAIGMDDWSTEELHPILKDGEKYIYND